MKPAVILLSGGLDSATALAVARSQGFDCYCLSFNYGQRHTHELAAAAKVAAALDARRHVVANIDLRPFGGSALTADIAVPKDHDPHAAGIPITYVPARNTVFLAFALGWAEVLHAFDIFIGVNAVDYSGYPDCRPEFIRAFQILANLATAAGVENKGRFSIHAPLIDKTKAQIIQWGAQLGVDFSLTHSCYDPVPGPANEPLACGHCDSCQLRREGFKQANLPDPTKYPSDNS